MNGGYPGSLKCLSIILAAKLFGVSKKGHGRSGSHQGSPPAQCDEGEPPRCADGTERPGAGRHFVLSAEAGGPSPPHAYR